MSSSIRPDGRYCSAREEVDEQRKDETAPDWAAWVDDTELDIMAGRCWTELRRPLRAVPVLTTALARYDDLHARDEALYLSWLADALLMAGEVEEAARATGDALDLAVGVASVRPGKRLAPVLTQLARHRELPAVRDSLERASAQAVSFGSLVHWSSASAQRVSRPGRVRGGEITGR